MLFVCFFSSPLLDIELHVNERGNDWFSVVKNDSGTHCTDDAQFMPHLNQLGEACFSLAVMQNHIFRI